MPTYAEIGGANAIGTDKQIRSGIAAIGLSGSRTISMTGPFPFEAAG